MAPYQFGTAQEVGHGLPADTGSTPDCPSGTVGPIAGVIVLGQRDVPTYFSGIVGLHSIPGRLPGDRRHRLPPGELRGGDGRGTARVIPVAIPVKQVTCDGSNNAVLSPVRLERRRGHHLQGAAVQQQPGQRRLARLDTARRWHAELEAEILHSTNPAIDAAQSGTT